MPKIRTNLPPEELEAIAKALQAMAAHARGDDLNKGVGSATVKPKGAPSSRKDGASDAAMKPPSMPGLAAPGNTAGPGRGNKTAGSSTDLPNTKVKVNEGAKTNVSMNSAVGGQEFVYLSKKDFPDAPKGTVDSTPNSWKVPAGLGRALQAKAEASQGRSQADQPTDDVSFNKQPKSRAAMVIHLKHGEIESITPLGADSASETFKVKIKGNGSAIFKGQVEALYDSTTESKDVKPVGEQGWTFNERSSKWEKETKEAVDIYQPKAAGSFGSGNIPYRRNVEREESGYNVACLVGMDQLVPVTVSRSHEGKAHSLQQWKEGFSSISALAKAKGIEDANNHWEVISKVVPREKHDKVAQQFMDIACFDIIINNQDRHGHNFIINEQGDVQLIDHGFAFGNGMHGSRNHFLQNMFHKNKPIKLSDTMKTRLDNLSLGDYKRAMPNMFDWEQGQAFLRSRYVSWLQENHGSIDRQKFVNIINRQDGSMPIPGDASDWYVAGSSKEDQWLEHSNREEEGLLPHQMFESWAKAYLEEASSNADHRDHKDAKQLQELGVFMGAGFCAFMDGKGAEFYRALNKHKEYEKSIKPSMEIPASVHKEMSDRRQKKYADDKEKATLVNNDATVVDRGSVSTRAGDSNKTKR